MHAETVFWFCAGGLFYTYAGYPLLALLLAFLFRRRFDTAPFTGQVSVLIAVHNDTPRLIPKLQGLLRVKGADRIQEVLVGSDGSNDGIVEAVVGLSDPRVRVIAFAERRGKASVLNQLMTLADGEVIVLTDARQPLVDDALDRLLEPFADPRVGVVSGHLVFRRSGETGGTASGIGSYWSYEKQIRRWESLSGSVPGATGALYAIRRSLLFPLDPRTILDDVMIPMQAMQRGARCIFAPGAICHDEPSAFSYLERIRKRRTIAGVIQVALMRPRWLLPWGHPLWFRFISHKILRLFCPFLFAGLLLSSAALWSSATWRVVCMVQVAGWTLAGLGLALEARGVRSRLLAVPLMFASLILSTLLAWVDALRGRFSAAWRRA